jgi:amino acid adenylation domain-containing protein
VNTVKNLIDELKANEIDITIEADGKLKVHFKDGVSVNDDLLASLRENKEALKRYLTAHLNLNNPSVAIPKLAEAELYPVSDAQKRLWILSQFEGVSAAYNTPRHLDLDGPFDPETFQRAIRAVIERHEILRTVFKKNFEGEIYQRVIANEDFHFHVTLIDCREQQEKEHFIRNFIKEDAFKAFDLEKGPLLRAFLFQAEEGRYVFYYNMHHIIGDAWSSDILKRDVLAHYEAVVKNEQVRLPDLKIQYKDYASWQLSQLEQASYLQHRDFWQEKLGGELPVLELPGSRLRPAVKTNEGHSYCIPINKADSNSLKAFAIKHGGSTFMALVSSIKALFYFYTGQEEFILGTPVAGRKHSDLEDQIGCYINTLVLRNEVSKHWTFRELFEEVKRNTIEAYAHQDYPFDRLVEEIELKRDAGRNPVFDVMLTYNNVSEIGFSGEEHADLIDLGEGLSKFDINLTFEERGEQFFFYLDYNTALYDGWQLTQMMKHYQQLLAALLKEPEKRLEDLEYLLNEEKEQLLKTFNNTASDLGRASSVIQLFQEQVEKTPENIALDIEGETYTYRNLDRLSNQLAHQLESSHQLAAGELAAIHLNNTLYLPLSILAVLKCGAAYVPIDPAIPVSRKRTILQESRASLLIMDVENLNEIDAFEKKLFCVDVEFEEGEFSDKNMKYELGQEDTAYVIYTSGSTGIPKGVEVKERSLVNYLEWGRAFYFEENDQAKDFGLFTSIAFDLTISSLFYPLISGGKLKLYSSTRDLTEVLKDYFTSELTCIKCTPSHLEVLASLKLENSKINTAIVGGDVLLPEHVNTLRNLNPAIRIFNEYGPTEATVGCVVQELNTTETPILIGKPIANTRILILSENGKLLPPGVKGEINISGQCLAAAYWGQEALSQEKFYPSPILEGEKCYKTGDIGAWLPDGSIQYFGRKDEQVKIRGYRIELGEIEAALLKVEEINEAVVLVKENEEKEKEILAFYTANKEFPFSDLKQLLNEVLPSYMLPAAFVRVEKIPLTSNGKPNKKQLLAEAVISTEEIAYQAPGNEIERKLQKIWQEALKKEKVGINDDFFNLGGHSLKAIKLLSIIEREFMVNIPISTFFLKNSISEVGAYLSLLIDKEAFADAEYEDLNI